MVAITIVSKVVFSELNTIPVQNILNVTRLKCTYNVVSSMVYCLFPHYKMSQDGGQDGSHNHNI